MKPGSEGIWPAGGAERVTVGARAELAELWRDLERGLAQVLDSLDADGILILSSSEDAAVPDAYVQFGATDTGLYAEAVSNAYLPASDRLSAGDEKRLQHLGWELPGDSGNWRVSLTGPDVSDLGARLAMGSLRHVYCEPDPRHLRVYPVEFSVPLEMVPYVEPPAEGLDELDDAQRVAVIADRFGRYIGRTAEGVHTVEVDGKYCRFLLDDLAGLRLATMCVLLDCDGAVSAEQLADVERMAAEAGDYRIESRPGPDGDPAIWLTTSLAVDPDYESLEEVFAECWQMAEAARWADAALDAGCSHS